MADRELVGALHRMLESVEEEKKSMLHAFSTANSRLYDYSVVVEDPSVREFTVKLSYVREALSRKATKSMRIRAREMLSSGIETGEYEVSEIQRSILVDSIYDLSFMDCIKEESRTEVDIRNVLEPLNEELISLEGDSFLEVYISIVRASVMEVDQEMREEVRELIYSFDEALPEEPTQEDWQHLLTILFEKMVEVDEEVRTMVSIT